MPELISFSEDQVFEMRRMRWAGASLREIASYLGVSTTTVLSYVRGIHPLPNGQNLVYTHLDAIRNWAPVLPSQELPLPQWFVNWMEARLKTMQQSPSTDLALTESEDDLKRRRP